MTSRIRTLALAAAVAATAAGCDDTTGTGGDATIRVLLTDAPADYIATAEVDIGAIEIIGEDHGIITLSTDGTDGLVNLLDLQNAATQTLASADIEPGMYHQIRLIVEEARVTLKEGYTFADGSSEKPLFVPSGAQTGIKLNLGGADGEGDAEGGIVIASGETVLVLDFDVNQSFVMQGNPESPAGIKGILFTPAIRVTVEDVAASISGAVSSELDVNLEDLEVSAAPVEGTTLEDYQTETATARTSPEGTFTIHFLVPGTYVVTVTPPEGHAVSPESIEVTVGNGEDATGVNFDIVAGG